MYAAFRGEDSGSLNKGKLFNIETIEKNKKKKLRSVHEQFFH